MQRRCIDNYSALSSPTLRSGKPPIVFQTMVLPVLFYGMHLVPLRKSDQRRLDSWFHTRVWWILGIRWEEKITNQEVWQRATAMLGQPLCPPSTQLCHISGCVLLATLLTTTGYIARNAVHSKGSEKTAWKALHKVVVGCHPKRHPSSGIPKTIRRRSFHVRTEER